MLILTRREGEHFLVGDHIAVSVHRVGVEKVTLGIYTPRGMASGEQILIGDEVVVSVDHIGTRKVTFGISAPRGMPIDRAEVREKVEAEGRKREP